MKTYFLVIETPDCFEPNADTVEIHFKGAPKGSYIKAHIGDTLAFDYKKKEILFSLTGGNNGK